MNRFYQNYVTSGSFGHWVLVYEGGLLELSGTVRTDGVESEEEATEAGKILKIINYVKVILNFKI